MEIERLALFELRCLTLTYFTKMQQTGWTRNQIYGSCYT